MRVLTIKTIMMVPDDLYDEEIDVLEDLHESIQTMDLQWRAAASELVADVADLWSEAFITDDKELERRAGDLLCEQTDAILSV